MVKNTKLNETQLKGLEKIFTYFINSMNKDSDTEVVCEYYLDIICDEIIPDQDFNCCKCCNK